MNSKYLKKTRIVYELEYTNNFQLIGNLFLEWKKLRPDNPELKSAAQALANIGVYVAGMQMEAEAFEKICSEYRSEKLKYQKEALDASEKLNNYEQKYFKETGN